MKLKQTFFALVLLSAIAAGSSFAQNYGVGQANPSFDLAKFGGGRVKAGDYPGKILFLNFFGYN